MRTFLLCLVVGWLFTGVGVRAADPAAASQPAEPKRAFGETADRVYGDLRLLKDLSEEQKRKIHAVWVDFRARIDALEKERDAKMEGLLTEAQKAELNKLRDEKEINAKKRAAEQRKADKAEAERLKAELERLRAQAAASQPAKK